MFEIDSRELNIKNLFQIKLMFVFLLYQQLEIFFVSDEELIQDFYQEEMMVLILFPHMPKIKMERFDQLISSKNVYFFNIKYSC